MISTWYQYGFEIHSRGVSGIFKGESLLLFSFLCRLTLAITGAISAPMQTLSHLTLNSSHSALAGAKIVSKTCVYKLARLALNWLTIVWLLSATNKISLVHAYHSNSFTWEGEWSENNEVLFLVLIMMPLNIVIKCQYSFACNRHPFVQLVNHATRSFPFQAVSDSSIVNDAFLSTLYSNSSIGDQLS